MRWTKTDDGWRKRFALFPFCISNGPEQTWVWLEWYWLRWEGLYNNIRLINPAEEHRVAMPRPD